MQDIEDAQKFRNHAAGKNFGNYKKYHTNISQDSVFVDNDIKNSVYLNSNDKRHQ